MPASKNTPSGAKAAGGRTSGKGTRGSEAKKIRYAVVGLGYFAQSSALPAFAHAKKNSELVALVSDDPEKLKKLGRKYGAQKLYNYGQFDALLSSGEIDAVYIALPNDLHKEYAIRAAKAGVHVLCEKPMALAEKDCREMIRAAAEHQVRLMIGYRLHLDQANLQAVETVKSGKLGDARFIFGAFSMQVVEGNTRVMAEHGGGPLYDLGIYCINSARYLFQDEPTSVVAFSSRIKGDPRFQEVDEMASVILRFPRDRQATFTCSFGAADLATFTVAGTKGTLLMKQAYDNAFATSMEITLGGKTKSKEFQRKDQVAAEFLYFSDCILSGRDPEPSGLEGLADVRIINAIQESLVTGKPVAIERVDKKSRPSASMEIDRPPVAKKPDLVHAEEPTQD